MSTQYLRRYHILLYTFVEYLEACGFEWTRESYEAAFDGSFAIHFRLRVNVTAPGRHREFRLTRDGRDNILELEELLAAPDDRGNHWSSVGSRGFAEKDAWPAGILAATQSLLKQV